MNKNEGLTAKFTLVITLYMLYCNKLKVKFKFMFKLHGKKKKI